MRTHARALVGPLAITLLLLGSCADYSMKSSDEASSDGGSSDTGGSGAWGGDSDTDTDSDTDSDTDHDDGYGSEVEDDYLSLEPAATNAYVFVANPTRDTVTRVSVPSLAVETTDVGSNPAVVATTDDYTLAVSFNQDSDDVTIIDATTLETVTIDVRGNFNTMVMSPDGKWVICYHDESLGMDGSDEDGGAQSFNEISIVDLHSYEHYPMVVGFMPHDIQFTDDSATAIVVSDAYLGVVDLSGSEPSRELIELSDDLINPPAAEEVLVAPDGSYVFVRQYGTDELVVVDLVARTRDYVQVGANATDLDITPDGLQAVAVARGSGELWLYELADPFAAAEVIDLPDSAILGSLLLSPDDSQGILFSTQSNESRYATWDRGTNEITVRSLVKPVESVAVSPDGGTALIFHPKSNGDDVDEESQYYDHHALTLVDLSDPRIFNAMRLAGAPTAWASSEDGTTGFFVMDTLSYLEVIDYSSLIVTDVELKSAPVHLGVLPETTWAYVSQEHDLGRMSFYDWDSEVLQTITGFELNSGIEH